MHNGVVNGRIVGSGRKDNAVVGGGGYRHKRVPRRRGPTGRNGYKALNEYNIQKKTKSHGNLLRNNDLLGHLGAEVGIKRISIHR